MQTTLKRTSLCAGQQQLLALARVLLQRPRLVLLDECDAALDASSAAAVRALLATQLPDATILQACPGCCVLLGSMLGGHPLAFAVLRRHVLDYPFPGRLLGSGHRISAVGWVSCAELVDVIV